MSELLRRQQLFMRLLPTLIDHAHELGFQVTPGEIYRPMEMVELDALRGVGSRASLHPLRLAIDLHLFRPDTVWLTTTEAHKPLGIYWELLHPLARWGGRFARPDGNHYSISYEGRA